VLDRFFRRKPAPLTGAPPVRRLKSYSAESGYVYQYFYLGCRPSRDEGGGTEFCFDVSADRKTSVEVSVLVSDAAVCEWERAHGRAVIANERYAAAKMSLFQAFDERPPDRIQEAIRVRTADLEAILATLGLD
jgi:hypothetical protein